jgi:poly(3-hydroxybutyrate) depolymerase
MHPAILLAAIASALAGTSAAEDWSLTIGGASRTATVTAPSGIASPPLVIAMHGMGGNGKQHQRMSRFDALAEREKFVVAYPDGLEQRWGIHGDQNSVVDFSRLADILRGWATRNERPQTPQTVTPYPETKADSKVSKQHWTPCNKSEIIALTIAGFGHVYSMSPDIKSSEEARA